MESGRVGRGRRVEESRCRAARTTLLLSFRTFDRAVSVSVIIKEMVVVDVVCVVSWCDAAAGAKPCPTEARHGEPAVAAAGVAAALESKPVFPAAG